MSKRPKPMRYWTGNELCLLRAEYRSRGAAWLAERLHRSIGSVYAQARREGICRSWKAA